MAFEWDDLHERVLGRWGAGSGGRLESKRTVGRATMQVDVAIWGGLARPPVLASLPATGLLGVENKAPTVRVSLREVLRFTARLQLLVERELQEGRPVEWDRTAGLLLCPTLADGVADLLPWGPARVLQLGHRVWHHAGPALHVIEANHLACTVRNAPLILYYGNDETVRRLMAAVEPDQYASDLFALLVVRREVVREELQRRGLSMSELKLDIKGAVEDVGLARVIEEVGLARVIEEVGLARVIEEIGLATVIEQVGGDQVMDALGPERIREYLRRIEGRE